MSIETFIIIKRGKIMETKLNDQELARREKLNKLKELKVDPFGKAFKRTDTSLSCNLKIKNKSDKKLEKEPIRVAVAGRIMLLRKMGKASFINIQDREGRIQGYISIDTVGKKKYEVFKACDVGDIVGLKGKMMRTRTGEPTIKVDSFTLLTKSLKILPEKYHGLVDIEERSRHRYVDLIMNEDAKKTAIARNKIIRSIQHYLDSLGFIEVETPVLSPILGGASARPFITHHNTLDKNFYLRIATELKLKELIVGGLEKVYEIGRIFRNEGMDAKHNPEFTSIELYEAYSDLKGIGKLWENLLRYVAKDVTGSLLVPYGDIVIDFKSPFKWVSMVDIVKEKTGFNFRENLDLNVLVKYFKDNNIKIEKHWNSQGYFLAALFDEYCEKELIQPTFLYEHPIETSPLTKKTKDPRYVERFELYINGTELANAYSELNDPIDQYERFEAQLSAKERGDEEANEMDLEFIDALNYGMAPTGGIGMGIDRLVMFLTNQDNLREVILFPTMKDEK